MLNSILHEVIIPALCWHFVNKQLANIHIFQMVVEN